MALAAELTCRALPFDDVSFDTQNCIGVISLGRRMGLALEIAASNRWRAKVAVIAAAYLP